MSLLKAVQEKVQELRNDVRSLNDQARGAVEKINSISHQDIRDKTEEVSKTIKELDNTRRAAVKMRRKKIRELSAAASMLIKTAALLVEEVDEDDEEEGDEDEQTKEEG